MFDTIAPFTVHGARRRRRIVSILVWFGILGIGDALAAHLHVGPVIKIILTLNTVFIASVVAAYVSGISLLPARGLLAAVVIGPIVGVLGGHVVAGHYHLGATAAEISMVGGGILIETVFLTLYLLLPFIREGRRDVPRAAEGTAFALKPSIVDKSPASSCSFDQR